jgi:glycosyltransferase involved in cell wall biosynthesis
MLEFELILPCYNESKSLQALIERTLSAAAKHGFTPDRFQLVLVENGSKDDSSLEMDKLHLGPYGAWFRKVQVLENKGYGFGLWTGLKSTTAQYLAWSHADQQCDPLDVFEGLKLLKKQSRPSLVKGLRRGRNWKDRLVTKIFEFLARCILGMKVSEINAQPKVFPRSLLDKIKNPPDTFAFDLYVLSVALRNKYSIASINVEFPPRIHGVSNWASTFFSRYKTIAGMIRYMVTLAQNEGRL